MRLDLLIESGRVRASVQFRGRIIWAAESSYSDAVDLEAVLGTLASERPRHTRRATVVLGDDVARVKTIDTLPALARAELAAHVQLHSRRYFLQNGIPLVTDAMPVLQNGTTTARIGAIPMPLAEAIIAGLEAGGIACDSITPAGAPALSLLPPGAKALRVARLRTSVRRWAALAALSALSSIAAHVLMTAQTLRSAESELGALHDRVEAALAARRDADAAGEAIMDLAQADRATPRRARFLTDLTRALPDSAFLVSLRFETDGGGSLSGYAPRASSVAARLERTGVVAAPVPEGTVTREVIAGRELERFAIRFRLPRTGTAP